MQLPAEACFMLVIGIFEAYNGISLFHVFFRYLKHAIVRNLLPNYITGIEKKQEIKRGWEEARNKLDWV